MTTAAVSTAATGVAAAPTRRVPATSATGVPSASKGMSSTGMRAAAGATARAAVAGRSAATSVATRISAVRRPSDGLPHIQLRTRVASLRPTVDRPVVVRLRAWRSPVPVAATAALRRHARLATRRFAARGRCERPESIAVPRRSRLVRTTCLGTGTTLRTRIGVIRRRERTECAPVPIRRG